MNDNVNEQTIPSISEEQWLHHFESLHSKRSNTEMQDKLTSDLTFMEKNTDNQPLNESIT